ncbi:MAG: serine/threonine protein kinase [Blastocatellia bacterium]|nr:serine/threonine protein kinase [Blastocatellia bacterium]
MGLLDELIGQVLDGKYRMDKKLGQGGMGAVYLSTHVGTGRPVAVKVITPRYMTNEEFVGRFKREARAAGLLRHPNVVNVTDFGFASALDQSVAYLVMEYLDGCSLSDVLKEEKSLPLDWVVDIIEQVCLAIDKAHRHGIIHRDLKPDNIWLEPDERGGQTVKVLDFGLAKLAGIETPAGNEKPTPARESPAPRPANETATEVISSVSERVTEIAGQGATETMDYSEAVRSEPPARHDEQATEIISPRVTVETEPDDTVLTGAITQVGSVLGTPHYMSPEQCMGDPLDSTSDIYSLGVIAYEMLAGETPFTGDTYGLIVQHIQMPPPPLREKRPDIPAAVEELVMKALAKRPQDRPASAAAFASAFRARVERAGTILRKALGLYGEHFPIFFRITLIAYIPAFAVVLLWAISDVVERAVPSLTVIDEFLMPTLDNLSSTAAWVINIGVFVPVVAQLMIAPLRPVNIRAAFAYLKKQLRPFFVATLIFYALIVFLELYIETIESLIGGVFGHLSLVNKSLNMMAASEGDYIRSVFFTCAILTVVFAVPAYYALKAAVNYLLYIPVIIMEGRTARESLAHSKELVGRSRRTVIKIMAIFVTIGLFQEIFAILVEGHFIEWRGSLITSITFGTTSRTAITMMDMFLNPLIAIALAMLYFKARQTGGETLKDVLGDYQLEELPQSEWQARMLKPLSIRISGSSGSRPNSDE